MDRHRARLAPAWAPWVLAAGPVVFVALFFVLPVAAIVARGFEPSAIADVLGSSRVRGVLWFTVWQAALCSVLAMLIGLAPAYVLSRYRVPGRRTVLALVTVPFVLPTVVVGSAFLTVLPGSWRRSVLAMVIAHVWVNLAVVIRTVGASVAQLDPALGDAAATLGAGPWRTMRHVTLPLLRPAIAASGSIVFLFCLTSFGIARLLGGPTRPTLEVEIWRVTTQRLDLRTASVLALVQLVVVLALMGAWTAVQARSSRMHSMRTVQHLRNARTHRGRMLVIAVAALTAIIAITPLLVLAVRSLRTGAQQWSLDAWRTVFGRPAGSVPGTAPNDTAPWESLITSLRIAAVATVIAVVIGTLAACAIALARRGSGLLDTGLMLPLGTSAVTVGFGLLITFDRAPMDLRGSWVMLPLGQALVAMPFVVRVVLPTLRAIDPGLREAAATLGAPPRRVWREVDLPVLRRAIGVACGFALAMSLGEFGATSFLTRVGNETAPIVIARLLSRPSQLNLATSSALATLLAGATLAVMLVIDRLRGERGVSF